MTSHRPSSQQNPDSHRMPSLLIADDDPIVSSTLCAQLSQHFDIVGDARDADEAIALAAEHMPDVAIIDVQMPGGGGLRATQEMQNCAADTAIVAFSVDESDTTVREIMNAGAITYLRKGVRGQELALALHRAIEAHALLRQPAQQRIDDSPPKE